ncbi:unnamed protein product [Staurois parvus]|uniref:Uncharacterized protein n=1 Tax=Staurois parvus TaxID=386267 RepID=A0ABN9CDD9_9NEOB|nr:unnamed protein product [Staurois parvus]
MNSYTRMMPTAAGIILRETMPPLPRCLSQPSRAVLCHRGNLRMQLVFLPDDHRADWRPEWCQSSL